MRRGGFPAAVAIAAATSGAGAELTAQGACSPMDEAAFNAAVADARAFIAEEDLDGYERACLAIEQSASCLTFVPSPEAWGGFLVGLAAVNYYQGGDWRDPLASALAAVPGIDRAVNPEHEIATWTPPAPTPPVGEVPDGVTLYVDGVETRAVPAPVGIHLLQVRIGDGALQSTVVRNEPVPDAWLVPPEPPDDDVGSPYLVYVSGAGGFARRAQAVDAPGDFAADVSHAGFDAGFGLFAWFGRRLGAGIDAVATLTSPLDVVAGAGIRVGRVGLGVGAAVVGAHVFEADELRLVPLAAPALTAAAGVGAIDVGGSVAAWPSLVHATARAGVAIPTGPVRARAGLGARFARSSFVQPGVVVGGSQSGFDRSLAVSELAVLAQIGVGRGQW